MLIPIPYRDPVAVYAGISREAGSVLLDSADGTGLSYVATRPRLWITQSGDEKKNPFLLIAELLSLACTDSNELVNRNTDFPFTGGVIGFLGYELNRWVEERLPSSAKVGFNFPHLAAGLYDSVAIFDSSSRETWVSTSNKLEASSLVEQIVSSVDLPPISWKSNEIWHADLSRSDYESKVRCVIDAIKDGDVFQVNLSQRLLATLPRELTPIMLYRRLRTLAPAPFAACFNLGAEQFILSASPERFLKVGTSGLVETRPIKGTCVRGKTDSDDRILATALATSVKDYAENLMIVDLLRSDLAKNCRPGSVHVPRLCQVESFANVHHLVSTVKGQLSTDCTSLDLLRGAFPSGSVTGAPKHKAMEIISELEPCWRGPYCGTIIRLGYDGSMDSSVIIRTLVVDGRNIAAHVGGGVVHDSDPAGEWRETMIKAEPLLQALSGKSCSEVIKGI